MRVVAWGVAGRTQSVDLLKITQLAAQSRPASCELDESICAVQACFNVCYLVGLADEVNVGAMGDDAAIVAHGEQLTNGVFAVFAVVEGALVDVHADEAIGERGFEVAGELHGVGESFFAVVERVLDAVAEGVGGGEESFSAEGAADGVAAEG